MAPQLAIEMRGITKRFPGVLANNRANIALKGGELHALLGENGAGKTTLMNVLYGLYQPDDGEIFIRGKRVRISSPREAINLGIGMVHQHFMLVPVLSVVENILLGLPTKRGPFINLSAAKEEIVELSKRSGLQVDPTTVVWHLPVGVQQRVEILKFLYRGARILILDEPTAVLTPNEVMSLFEIIRKLKQQGVTIILITHKLREVMEISDRVTVMRDGASIETVQTKNTNIRKLARLMVGRDVVFQIERHPLQPGCDVLEIDNLQVQDDRGLPAVQGVSLAVREREIVGIAGVSGNGQSELAEAISGIRQASSGSVIVCGEDLTNQSPARIIKAGVSQIPPDRNVMGSISDFTLSENFVLPIVESYPFSKRGILDWNKIREYGETLINDFDVRCRGSKSLAKWLSGGNLQKLILARELARAPRLIIAMEPTRGLDVAATEFVRKRLLEEGKRGAAILLISSDLDEIMILSDRIAVMYEGRIIDTVERSSADLTQIAMMMAGAFQPTGDTSTNNDARI